MILITGATGTAGQPIVKALQERAGRIRVLTRDPAKAAMFEDLSRNLEVPHALGMTTVLVVPEGSREVFRESWELEGRDAAHVDHVTDDLTGFLSRMSPARP